MLVATSRCVSSAAPECCLSSNSVLLREVLDTLEVHEPGDVYARDDFVYWGFSPEGLRRLAGFVGLDEVEVVDELEIDGHARILAVLRAAG